MRVVAPIEHLTTLYRALRSSRERTWTERSAVGVHPVGQILLGCGILAAALYVAMIFAVGALTACISSGPPSQGLFFTLETGFGAAMLGWRFRLWSIATMAIGLASGAVTGTYFKGQTTRFRRRRVESFKGTGARRWCPPSSARGRHQRSFGMVDSQTAVRA